MKKIILITTSIFLAICGFILLLYFLGLFYRLFPTISGKYILVDGVYFLCLIFGTVVIGFLAWSFILTVISIFHNEEAKNKYDYIDNEFYNS